MGSYPATAPALNADVLTISRFLNDPTLVNRRVNELASLKFISDFLLTGRHNIEGGALLYEIAGSGGLYTSRDPEIVAPGAEYPRATPTEGAVALAKASKWGQDIPITDERIKREKTRALERGLSQVATTVIRKIDTVAMTGIGAAVTKTIAASAAWTSATPSIFLDVARAAASIEEEDQGYEADTVVCSPTLFAYVRNALLPALPRESADTTLTTGELPAVNGLTFVPSNRLPAGTNALVLDRKVFGGIGYEDLPSPEYEGDPATGIETWSRRNPAANDEWLVRGRRPVVPVIQEPSAGRKITGV